MLTRRKTLQFAASVVAMPFVSSAGWPQSYPSRPVTIVVPFAAGGGADIVARLMGQWLSERIGKPVVIENRPGAATKYRYRSGRACVARRSHTAPG
jgi:tripartite-type tricarboxylate transporter receptor subunit TctC